MPRGSKTSWSAGHCSSGTCHGRSSSAGSLGAASIWSGIRCRQRPVARASVDQPFARGRREQVQVPGFGREVHGLALARRLAPVDAGNDIVLLAVDLGSAEDVGVGTELLDDV